MAIEQQQEDVTFSLEKGLPASNRLNQLLWRGLTIGSLGVMLFAGNSVLAPPSLPLASTRTVATTVPLTPTPIAEATIVPALKTNPEKIYKFDTEKDFISELRFPSNAINGNQGTYSINIKAGSLRENQPYELKTDLPDLKVSIAISIYLDKSNLIFNGIYHQYPIGDSLMYTWVASIANLDLTQDHQLTASWENWDLQNMTLDDESILFPDPRDIELPSDQTNQPNL